MYLYLLRKGAYKSYKFFRNERCTLSDQSASPQRSLSFVSIKVLKWSKSYLLCYNWKEWLLGNSNLNNFSENSIWRHILILPWFHSYKLWFYWYLKPYDMSHLLLCCSDDSQKCEWKVINTEETQKKKTMKKTLIWKHDIGFLNFRRNITFTILVTL